VNVFIHISSAMSSR